jgi:hypothetical protein
MENHPARINQTFKSDKLYSISIVSENDAGINGKRKSEYLREIEYLNKQYVDTFTKKKPAAKDYISMQRFESKRPMTISWKRLEVKVENQAFSQLVLSRVGLRKNAYKTILHGLNGLVEPGQMLALMGPR